MVTSGKSGGNFTDRNLMEMTTQDLKDFQNTCSQHLHLDDVKLGRKKEVDFLNIIIYLLYSVSFIVSNLQTIFVCKFFKLHRL